VVNVRASYFDETREQIDGLWSKLAYRKVGVTYPEDAFGATVLQGVKEALRVHGTEPTAVASYERQTPNVSSAIDTVRAAAPQAVVLVGPPNTVAPILKQAHTKGWKPLFLTSPSLAQTNSSSKPAKTPKEWSLPRSYRLIT
jgi:branched-chain amino acid transport system substrate-binding protein